MTILSHLDDRVRNAAVALPGPVGIPGILCCAKAEKVRPGSVPASRRGS